MPERIEGMPYIEMPTEPEDILDEVNGFGCTEIADVRLYESYQLSIAFVNGMVLCVETKDHSPLDLNLSVVAI